MIPPVPQPNTFTTPDITGHLVSFLAALLASAPQQRLPFTNDTLSAGRGPVSTTPPPMAQPILSPQGFGASVADGPVGENAQLGWGTAPPATFQPPMQHPALHKLPVPHYNDSSRAPQTVRIAGPFGTAGANPHALLLSLLGKHFW